MFYNFSQKIKSSLTVFLCEQIKVKKKQKKKHDLIILFVTGKHKIYLQRGPLQPLDRPSGTELHRS